MTARKEFANAIAKPIKVTDSRFGIRKIILNPNNKPSIFTYANPGRAWWGTK